MNVQAKVEGLVGLVRRNFMTPVPMAESFRRAQRRFPDARMKRRQAILRGQTTTTIGERMQAELARFMTLPPTPFDTCDKVNTTWVPRMIFPCRANQIRNS